MEYLHHNFSSPVNYYNHIQLKTCSSVANSQGNKYT